MSPPDVESHHRAGPVDVPTVVRRLGGAYGPRPWRKHRGGIDGLVRTILSQNTSDVNSSAAFCSLKRRFSTWQQMLNAPTAEIERAIRVGGLAHVKAPRIKAALLHIRRTRGKLSLAFLAHLPVDEAREYLQGLDGIGPKTACCVLMFCYNRPTLPVDTHVHRVARRVGLIPPQCSAEAAHALLQRACPPEMVYPFHVLMVEHGRRTCRARDPKCRECFLADVCRSFPVPQRPTRKA